MTVTVGTGAYVYEYHGDWPRLPPGQAFEKPSGVAVDSHDRVYVVQKSRLHVLVFDQGGYFLDAWARPPNEQPDCHLIYISPNDEVYLADREAHHVLRYTTDGKRVMALGTRNRAQMQAPFNHPTAISVAPWGEIYISDGYANSSVHRFTPEGEHLSSFGSPGSDPGQFKVPRSLRVSADGRVFVCDRENNRVQVFIRDGQYITEWTDFIRPMGIHIDSNQIAYVTDMVPRLSILNLEGELLARGLTFTNGHNVFTDSRGDIYSVDFSLERVQKFVKI